MTRPPSPVRLASPRDLLDAIPHALGFRPHDSLVIVLLRECDGGRRRTVLTVRIDLVGPLLPEASLVDWVAVASGATSSAATSSVMAVFVDTEPRSMPAVMKQQGELLQLAADVLSSVGAPLSDVLVVTNGSYFSLMCEDPSCCPPAGTAYDPRTPGTAGLELAVSAGSSPLVDRAELAKRFAADPDEVDLVRVELERRGRTADPAPSASAEGEAVTSRPLMVERVIGAAHEGFDLAEAAWVLTALHDVHVRDGVLASVLTSSGAREARDARGGGDEVDDSDERAMRRYVARLTRCAPPSYTAAPATMAAILEWVDGDGAAANIALDRAQADRPDYRLALLMAEVVRAAVPPTQVRQLLARVA